MKCPKCHGNLKVIDVVHRDDNISLRKKRCCKCGANINTMEFIAQDNETFEDEWNKNHRLTKLKETRKN